MDAIIVTFTADDTVFNIWVWPKADGSAPDVQVNATPRGRLEWVPHLGPVQVELQGSMLDA